ncbi:MAG TPA: DUF6526 family protein [Thermoanaerobaculia bacterium]|jgi:hypothetical protein|nr:DUF6526 family protein [Thermoanaerobaculia bacterium]
MTEQNYRNHRKLVPGFHFVTVGILVLNLLWSLYRLFRPPVPEFPLFDRLLGVLVAGALIGVAWYARTFPMGVQDRVIRNEMQARLAAVLPPDLRPRIGELRRGQIIALRFASDEELPELTRQVLDGRLAGGEDIKKAIRSWQADHMRA